MSYNTTYAVTTNGIPLYMNDGKEQAFKLIVELMAGVTHSDEFKPFIKEWYYTFWECIFSWNQTQLPVSTDYYTAEVAKYYVMGVTDYRADDNKRPKALGVKLHSIEYYSYSLGRRHAGFDKFKSPNFQGYYF